MCTKVRDILLTLNRAGNKGLPLSARTKFLICHNLMPFYGRNNSRPVFAIRRTVENFERTFFLHNVQVLIRQKTARSNENIATAFRRSQELGMSRNTTWRILRRTWACIQTSIKLFSLKN